MKLFTDLKKNMSLYAFVCLILGIVLVCVPNIAIDIVCYCLGGLIVLQGIFCIIRYFLNKSTEYMSRYDMIVGLISIVVGLFVIIGKNVVIFAIPYVFGFIIILDGIMQIQKSVDLKKCAYPKWWIILIPALLSILLGGVMLFNPFAAIKWTVIFIGICLLYDGIMNLFTAFFIGKAQNTIRFYLDTKDSGKE